MALSFAQAPPNKRIQGDALTRVLEIAPSPQS
jgi:hypothetical protein